MARQGGICIVLDDKWRLGSDQYNIILEGMTIPKKGPYANKEFWKAEYFFKTIDEACIKWLKIRTGNSDANNAAKLITEWNKNVRIIKKSYKEHFNKLMKEKGDSDGL